MARAAVDVGSNSILLTIVDDGGVVCVDEARVVGLGRGLGDRGLFAPDRLAAAEEVLTDYVARARSHGIAPEQVRAVATSAARRAMNAPTWFAKVQRELGLRIRVITGDEEARLTWLGSLRDLQLPPGPRLVVDLGGGSTELVLGEDGVVSRRVSLEIGSVRLTEAFLPGSLHGAADPGGLARMRHHIDAELAAFPMSPAPRVVIGVAGTVTTLATMALGLARYDAERVHGSRLTRVDLARFVDRLLAATPDARRAMVPASPERADWLVAGATVLDRVLAAARRPSLVVSDRGLRYGLLALP